MHVKELVPRVKGLAVKAGGFMRRRKRLTIAVVVAALLLGPLLKTDGELVFLNAVGLGLGALLLRRFIRSGGRQRTARATQHEATVLKVKSNDRRPSESGHARASHA